MEKVPSKLKGAVCKSYIRPANMHRKKLLCLKESEMAILRSTERYMVRAMCESQLKIEKA